MVDLKKWVTRPVSNEEVFALLFILLIGKWMLPSMIIWLVPIQMGVNGVELTEIQALNVTTNLVDAWMPNLVKLNSVGLGMHGSSSGYVVNLLVGALPYIAFCYGIMVMWTLTRVMLTRVIIGFFVKKKVKKNG